jgi:hypothetical protein
MLKSKKSKFINTSLKFSVGIQIFLLKTRNSIRSHLNYERLSLNSKNTLLGKSRGDVPGWVLVVLMTTALVTGIWSIAAPKLTAILRNSLDAMSGIK